MVCFGLNLGLVALYAITKREVNVVQENDKNVKKAFSFAKQQILSFKKRGFYALLSVLLQR